MNQDGPMPIPWSDEELELSTPETLQASQTPEIPQAAQESPQPTEAPQEAVQEATDPFDEFPPQVKQDVNGLMWLGYLEDSFDFAGHHFTLRTLRGDEELSAAVAVQEYRSTLREPQAWMWAQVGMSLQEVDRDFNFCPPIGPDKHEFARARFNYVASKWFFPLCDYLFTRYTALQARQVRALDAIRNLPHRSLTPSTPFADSWTIKGGSESLI